MRDEVSDVDGYAEVAAAVGAADPDRAVRAVRGVTDRGATAAIAVIDELLATADEQDRP
jgi:hypothetical protein